MELTLFYLLYGYSDFVFFRPLAISRPLKQFPSLCRFNCSLSAQECSAIPVFAIPASFLLALILITET